MKKSGKYDSNQKIKSSFGRKSFFDQDCILVSRVKELNYWNLGTGQWIGRSGLPKSFKNELRWLWCRNCQINSEEICIGDFVGNIFKMNLVDRKKMPTRVTRRGKSPKHDERIMCLTSSYSVHPRLAYSILLSGGDDNDIKVWNIQTNEIVHRFFDHDRGISCVQFSERGCSHFVSSSWDGTLKVFDLGELECIHTFEDHTRHVNCLDVCFGGNSNHSLIFSGSSDNTVRIYDYKQKKSMAYIDLGNGIRSISCFPTKQLLIIGDEYGNLYCSDLRNRFKFLWTKPKAHSFSIRDILLNNQCNSFFTCGEDFLIKEFNVETGKLRKMMKERSRVYSIFKFKNKDFKPSNQLPLLTVIPQIMKEGRGTKTKFLSYTQESLKREKVVDNIIHLIAKHNDFEILKLVHGYVSVLNERVELQKIKKSFIIESSKLFSEIVEVKFRIVLVIFRNRCMLEKKELYDIRNIFMENRLRISIYIKKLNEVKEILKSGIDVKEKIKKLSRILE